jgi:hypothetical protein
MKLSATQKAALKTLVLSKVGGEQMANKYGNSLKYALSVHIKYIDRPWDGGFEGEGSVAYAVKCAVTILQEQQPVEELVLDIVRYDFEDGVREYDDLLDTVGLSTEELYNAIGVDNPFAAPAPSIAEYQVYYNPMDSAVEKYGFTNCISDAFVNATTEEEAVKAVGPMFRLISVKRLAHVDADFGFMSELQIRAAKRVIREQMSREEVTRTSFDYLVDTIDGHNAVDFLETNIPNEGGVYHYAGLTLSIAWAGVTTGYAGSRVWKIVRVVTPKPEAAPVTWNREQDRYSCEESILKAKGAAVVSATPVGPYSALPEYVTIQASKHSRLFKFNGERAKVIYSHDFGKVTVETAEGVKDCLLSGEYTDRSTNKNHEVSTLHGVPYTPEPTAEEGDIVRGPVTLYKVSPFGWNPKTHPGTLDAWRTVGEMTEYFKGHNATPTGYLFRITVSEFEVNFTSGPMKGAVCFWKQHVTNVRKDPFSDSLIQSLLDHEQNRIKTA